MYFFRPILANSGRRTRSHDPFRSKKQLPGRLSNISFAITQTDKLSEERCTFKYERFNHYSTSSVSLKMHQESLFAAEQEQQITKARILSDTGTDKVYNDLLHKLKEAEVQLNLIQNDPASDEKKVIKAMQAVATMQWDLGMLEQAQELQEQILSKLIQKHSTKVDGKAGPPKHLDIAIAMHTIGSIQSRLQNPQEAFKWFNASLAMKEDLLSSKYAYHFEIGKTLNGIALARMQLDQEDEIDANPSEYIQMLEEAESHYVHHGETVEVSDGSLKDRKDMSNHPHVASLDENIAMIYRKNGDLKMACQRYENALRIHEYWHDSASMEGNEQIMSLNMHLGDCLGGMQLYEKALERYRKALEQHFFIVKRDQKGKSRNEATAMTGILRHSIGLMQAHLSNYEEAMQEYEEALNIKRSFGGIDHAEVARTLNAMAMLLATKGEGEKALAHLNEALRIFQLNFSLDGGEDYEEDVIQTQKNIELVEKNLTASEGIANASCGGGGRGRGGTAIP